MLKMLFLGLLFTMVVLVVAATGAIYKRKDEISRSICGLFVVVLFAIIANSIFVMSDVQVIAEISHSLFLACIDWILLFMLRFVIRYTDYDLHYAKMIYPLFAIATVETISMVLNPIFHHVFTLESLTHSAFGRYFSPTNYSVYFYCHLVFCYVLVVWIYVLLIHKMSKTAKVYRRKYSSIITSVS